VRPHKVDIDVCDRPQAYRSRVQEFLRNTIFDCSPAATNEFIFNP